MGDTLFMDNECANVLRQLHKYEASLLKFGFFNQTHAISLLSDNEILLGARVFR